MLTHAEELARFCTDTLRFRELPPPTVRRAKEVLLDSVGIAICAADYDSSAAIDAALESLRSDGLSSDGPCTVWGTGRSASAEHAAFLNGAFVHTPEMDDTHSAGIIHPAASVVPAAVAAAEQYGADGRALLTGIVAGYEVAVRSSLALPPVDHRQRGFHGHLRCVRRDGRGGRGRRSVRDGTGQRLRDQCKSSVR